jgi:hypothetical protein
MPAALLSLLTGLISGAITAVVTYYSTYARARLDLTVEYDKDLRTSRLQTYKDLWRRLKPLARYTAERPLSYRIAKDTSEDMRNWYFDVGGIYLSRESRGPYFAVKKALQQIIDDRDLAQRPDDGVDPQVAKRVYRKGTALREELSNDIGTRRQSFLSDSVLPRFRRPR